MNKKLNVFHLSLAIIIKFIFSMIFFDLLTAIFYTLIFSFIYLIFRYYRKSFSLTLVIGIDFFCACYLGYHRYGMSLDVLTNTFIYFLLANVYLGYLNINYLARLTSFKSKNKQIAFTIDLGIKALDEENYSEALKCFEIAIKEHKKNYLGYMGMCNTLYKMDNKDLKKLKSYKKKCLKYAPKELKNSIANKYN